MPGEREQLLSRLRVPQLASPVVAPRDELVPVLVERAVRQRLQVRSQLLEDLEILLDVADDFLLQFCLKFFRLTVDQSDEVVFLALGNKRLFFEDVVD
jgi:hypothetical protein